MCVHIDMKWFTTDVLLIVTLIVATDGQYPDCVDCSDSEWLSTICMFVSVCVLCVCVRVCILCVYMHVCMHACICVCVCMQVCAYSCMYDHSITTIC